MVLRHGLRIGSIACNHVGFEGRWGIAKNGSECGMGTWCAVLLPPLRLTTCPHPAAPHTMPLTTAAHSRPKGCGRSHAPADAAKWVVDAAPPPAHVAELAVAASKVRPPTVATSVGLPEAGAQHPAAMHVELEHVPAGHVAGHLQALREAHSRGQPPRGGTPEAVWASDAPSRSRHCIDALRGRGRGRRGFPPEASAARPLGGPGRVQISIFA